MAPNREGEPLNERDDSLLSRLDAFDDALSAELDDARFSSGVPAELRSDDDEFLMMAGLSATPSDHAAPGLDGADVDTSKPLSFHEAGVEDVDGSHQADATTAADLAHDELSADVYAATPRSDLRSLIAGLSRPSSGESEPIPAARPSSSVDTEEEASPAPVESESGEGALGDDALEGMLDRVKGDILAGLRADLSALTHAQEEVAAGQRAAAAALAEQRAAVAALQRAQEAAKALDAPRALDADSACPPAPVAAAELAEAERLVEELRSPTGLAAAPSGEDRIDLSAIPSGAAADVSATAEHEPAAFEGAEGTLEPAGDPDAAIYGKPRREHIRRSSRLRRRRRRIVFAFSTAVALGALALAAAQVVPIISHRFVGPETLGATASALMDAEQYVQASNTYQQLAQNFPEAPGAEDAAFMAGYALACIPPGLGERHYTASIRLLDEFERRYPDSEKILRARLLRGILHHRLGNQVDAISLLTEVAQAPRADTSSTLPALRTLARAYSSRGEFEAARSKLMQAISLPENFALDRDYEELAALNATEASETPDPARQAHLAAEADRYYQLALALPSIEPSRKRTIELAHAELGRMRREGFPERAEARGGGFTATTEIAVEGMPSDPLAAPAAPPVEAEMDAFSAATEEASAAEAPAAAAEAADAVAPDTAAIEEGLRQAAETPLTTEELPDLDASAALPSEEGESP